MTPTVDRGYVAELLLVWGTSIASSYSMTVGGGNTTTPAGFAVALGGRKAAAPTNYAATSDAGSNLSPVSVALGGVTALAGDDVLWLGGVDTPGAGSFTAPSGYTNQQTQGHTASSGTGGGAFNLSTRASVSAGSTGTLTGTATLSSEQADAYGIVISLPAASSGPPKSQMFFGSLLPLTSLAWVIGRRRRLSERS